MKKIYHNCAQKVLSAFSDKYEIKDNMIDEFKKHGHGKAINNECGALFAAKYLLKDDHLIKESVEENFRRRAGDIQCKSIRSLNKISCNECVQTIVDLLKKYEE